MSKALLYLACILKHFNYKVTIIYCTLSFYFIPFCLFLLFLFCFSGKTRIIQPALTKEECRAARGVHARRSFTVVVCSVTVTDNIQSSNGRSRAAFQNCRCVAPAQYPQSQYVTHTRQLQWCHLYVDCTANIAKELRPRGVQNP